VFCNDHYRQRPKWRVIIWVKYRVKPWTSCGFLILSRICTTANSSNHKMVGLQIQPHDVPSHSGFFLFNHYNLQGSCIRTVIQPLVETAGLLISWVFPFLPRTIPTSTDWQGGVSFQTTPMGKITHIHSTRTGVRGLSPQRHTYGSESVSIVQGLVYDLNVYKTHGEWLSQWNLTTWDAFKIQRVFSFLPRPTDNYLRVP